MSILTVSDLEKGFGVDLLFSEVTFSIGAGQKMGLVGRNGCGKTTMLRILMGLEVADKGKISLASGRRLGYLRQEAPVNPDNSIIEEVRLVFKPLEEMAAKLSDAEQAEMAKEVAKVLARHPETSGKEVFDIPYRADLFWCYRI